MVEVSGGACPGSIFPILIGNDKGDTKIFAFDYNLAANRLVVAGSTQDKEIRKYDITSPTPLIIQYTSASLTFNWGATFKDTLSYRIDAVKYNDDASLIFGHASSLAG